MRMRGPCVTRPFLIGPPAAAGEICGGGRRHEGLAGALMCVFVRVLGEHSRTHTHYMSHFQC